MKTCLKKTFFKKKEEKLGKGDIKIREREGERERGGGGEIEREEGGREGGGRERERETDREREREMEQQSKTQPVGTCFGVFAKRLFHHFSTVVKCDGKKPTGNCVCVDGGGEGGGGGRGMKGELFRLGLLSITLAGGGVCGRGDGAQNYGGAHVATGFLPFVDSLMSQKYAHVSQERLGLD